MSKSIWWHLAMEFHLYPNTGHSTRRARECFECQRIAALIERAAS